MEISGHDALSDESGTAGRICVPLFDLRARREALLRAFNDLPDTDDGEVARDALVNEICSAELAIVEADARTHVDALVQIEQLCLWERDGVVVGGEQAMERLLRVLPARFERLAVEARS